MLSLVVTPPEKAAPAASITTLADRPLHGSIRIFMGSSDAHDDRLNAARMTHRPRPHSTRRHMETHGVPPESSHTVSTRPPLCAATGWLATPRHAGVACGPL